MTKSSLRSGILFCTLFFLLVGFVAQAQIQVKRVNSVTNPLVDSLINPLVGLGVTVQNIKSNLSENAFAMGTMRDPSKLLGMSRGLVLLTSRIDSLPRPNGPTFSGPANNPSPGNILSVGIPGSDTIAGASLGRNLLNRVVRSQPGGASRRTTDVSSVEFEVVSATDSLEFRYIFFSEEYPSFVCSNFNDAFGFFITGPGIEADPELAAQFPNTTNLARVPNTPLPVTINTVNSGIPGSSGSAANCIFTPEGIDSYVSNQSPDSPIWTRFKFDGLTKVLTAKVKVVPCQAYRLVLAVGDVQDASFDSGVIIEFGSLQGKGVATAAASSFERFPYVVAGCNDGKIRFSRCSQFANSPVTVRWRKFGDAVNGVDYNVVLPNGQLGLLPDSIVLPAGVFLDSFVIRGRDAGDLEQVGRKTLKLKYLDERVPFIENQPNFIADSNVLDIRKFFIFSLPDSINPISGTFNSYVYRWREIVNGDTVATNALSCTTCARPFINTLQPRTFVTYIVDAANGCRSSDTTKAVLRDAPPGPTTRGDTVCKQGSARLRAFGGSGDYKWYGSATGDDVIDGETSDILNTPIITQTTSYWVSIPGLPCESARTEVVAFVNNFTSSIQAAGSPVVFSAEPSAGTNFVWFLNDVPIPGANTSTFTPELTGNYRVAITFNKCRDTSAVFFFDPLSSDVELITPGMVLYPNPAYDRLYVQTAGRKAYQIMDMTGRVMYSGVAGVESNTTMIQVATLPDGIYTLVFKDANAPKSQRFIKKSR